MRTHLSAIKRRMPWYLRPAECGDNTARWQRRLVVLLRQRAALLAVKWGVERELAKISVREAECIETLESLRAEAGHA